MCPLKLSLWFVCGLFVRSDFHSTLFPPALVLLFKASVASSRLLWLFVGHVMALLHKFAAVARVPFHSCRAHRVHKREAGGTYPNKQTRK
jgi:hypothetical protein